MLLLFFDNKYNMITLFSMGELMAPVDPNDELRNTLDQCNRAVENFYGHYDLFSQLWEEKLDYFESKLIDETIRAAENVNFISVTAELRDISGIIGSLPAPQKEVVHRGFMNFLEAETAASLLAYIAENCDQIVLESLVLHWGGKLDEFDNPIQREVLHEVVDEYYTLPPPKFKQWIIAFRAVRSSATLGRRNTIIESYHEADSKKVFQAIANGSNGAKAYVAPPAPPLAPPPLAPLDIRQMIEMLRRTLNINGPIQVVQVLRFDGN